MTCQECKKTGHKSTVRMGGSTSTCMGYKPYYDEDGVYHSHDGNTVASMYSCSQGHSWTLRGKRPCPAEGCDFGGMEIEE